MTKIKKMEPTQKQIDLIKTLSQQKKVAVDFTYIQDTKTASDKIKELLNGAIVEDDKEEIKVPVNAILMGMTLKLVYRKWIDSRQNPLEFPDQFKKEVEKTYFLFVGF